MPPSRDSANPASAPSSATAGRPRLTTRWTDNSAKTALPGYPPDPGAVLRRRLRSKTGSPWPWPSAARKRPRRTLARAKSLGPRTRAPRLGAYRRLPRTPTAHAVPQYADAGLLGPDMTFVHCNHLSDDELETIAAAGGTVSLGIHCELNSTGIGRSPSSVCFRRGIRPSLSGDTETKCSGDMFTQMRMLWAFYRSTLTRMGRERAARCRPSLCATSSASPPSRVPRRSGRTEIGSLTPGKRADIVFIAPTTSTWTRAGCRSSVVLAAHEGNVSHVLVGGRFVKRNGTLTGVNTEALVDEALSIPARPLGASQ